MEHTRVVTSYDINATRRYLTDPPNRTWIHFIFEFFKNQSKKNLTGYCPRARMLQIKNFVTETLNRDKKIGNPGSKLSMYQVSIKSVQWFFFCERVTNIHKNFYSFRRILYDEIKSALLLLP